MFIKYHLIVKMVIHHPGVAYFQTNPPDEAPQILSADSFVFWKATQIGTTSGKNNH